MNTGDLMTENTELMHFSRSIIFANKWNDMKQLITIFLLILPAMIFGKNQRPATSPSFRRTVTNSSCIEREEQNTVAQGNIRVEELSQPYYSAKIIFADSTLAPISKSNLMIADVDGIMKDVTYKIRKDKSAN